MATPSRLMYPRWSTISMPRVSGLYPPSNGEIGRPPNFALALMPRWGGRERAPWSYVGQRPSPFPLTAYATPPRLPLRPAPEEILERARSYAFPGGSMTVSDMSTVYECAIEKMAGGWTSENGRVYRAGRLSPMRRRVLLAASWTLKELLVYLDTDQQGQQTQRQLQLLGFLLWTIALLGEIEDFLAAQDVKAA